MKKIMHFVQTFFQVLFKTGKTLFWVLCLLCAILFADKFFKTNIFTPYLSQYIKRPPETLPAMLPETANTSSVTETPAPHLSNTFMIEDLPNPSQATLLQSPLYTAAFWRTATLKDITQELEKLPDINQRNPSGQTLLMYAAAVSNIPEAIPLLLRYGADINARDNNGRSALMFAAALNPNPAIASQLLISPLILEQQDKNGWTAFMYAAAYANNPDLLALFLSNGADINQKLTPPLNQFQKADLANSFILAAKLGLKKAEQMIQDLYYSLGEEKDFKFAETAGKHLEEMGAEILGQDAGMTPLMLSAKYNHAPQMTAFLLKNGADPRLNDHNGLTALDYAKNNPALYQTPTYWKMNDMLYR